MKWNKKGLIYAPSGDLWWARGYALLPTAEVLNSKVIRVYFASLDDKRYGRIGYVDLDADNPTRVLNESREPVLDVGELGAFDDSGVNPSCIIDVSGKKYLYYIGWQRCERVPYMLFAGLATSKDGGCTFERMFRTPIFERTTAEPFLRSAPTVIVDEGLYKAWYVSGLSWTVVNGVQYPIYIIRFADSNDGVRWTGRDAACIDFEEKDEFGFGRPWVIKQQRIYRMWYSIRSSTHPYRIGYAESQDGNKWLRKDKEAGIHKSDVGWDSEMICYPCVVDVNGTCYMFYNGNRHGSTGFGCAVLEN